MGTTESQDLSQMFGNKKETPAVETEQAVEASPLTAPTSSPADALSGAVPSSIQQFKLGAKIPKPTERIVGTKGIALRVSPIMPSIWRIVMHYDKLLKKNIECFAGECCRHWGAPKERFIVPVVEYTTDREGNIVSPKFNVNYFRLGKQDYDTLCNLLKQIGDPTKVDFLATCTSSEWNTFDFVDIRDEVAAWRKYPELETAVIEKAKQVIGLMVPLEVTRLTRDEYLEMRAEARGETPHAQPASGTNLQDMIGGGKGK